MGRVELDGRLLRSGVLLAAGGFEQNDTMRAEYGVPGRAFDTMGAPGCTGAAHRAAIAAGADTDLMDQAWWSPGLVHPDGRAAFALCLIAIWSTNPRYHLTLVLIHLAYQAFWITQLFTIHV